MSEWQVMPPPLAYKPAEVAALLGVAEKSVRREIKAGRLPHIRWGQRRILVPAEALAEWLRDRALDTRKRNGSTLHEPRIHKKPCSCRCHHRESS